MRRITNAEIAVLAATLAIANVSSADEPGIPTLPTVSATGGYYPVTRWGYNSNSSWSGNLPFNTGQFTLAQQTSNLHALKCAKAYALTSPVSGQGAPLGGTTYIIRDYMWLTVNPPYQRMFTQTPSPPPTPIKGGPWRPLSGSTDITHDITLVSLPHNPTQQYLINTIAHEWAHQWGAEEAQATAVGDAAEAAYIAENGEKCGGLN